MWYDLIVLAVLALAVYRGATKGFVWQLATIAAILLCFIFAESLSPAVARFLPAKPPLNRWIAMFLLYLGFSFLSFTVARGLTNWIEKAKFTEYDRHLGGLFGLLKGVAFCLVMTFFVVTLSEKTRAYVLNTFSGNASAIVMDRLHPVMPDELHEVLEPYIHQLDRPDLPLKNRHDHAGHAHGDDLPPHPDDFPPEPSNDPFPGNPFEQPELGQDPTDDNELEDWLRELPVIFDAELQTLIVQALRNTAPVDRAELVDQLSSGIPELMRAAAIAWLRGKPSQDAPENGTDTPAVDSRRRQELIEKIAEIYSDNRGARAAFADEINETLLGLPERVVISVLEDWHADLYAVSPDPNPQTTFRTPLEDRIASEIDRSRVGWDALGPRWADRLRTFEQE